MHEIVDEEIVVDDVPNERVKRTKIPRVKIIGKKRLYRLIDEDEDDKTFMDMFLSFYKCKS